MFWTYDKSTQVPKWAFEYPLDKVLRCLAIHTRTRVKSGSTYIKKT